jgi:predicted nucleotidyltransferase
MSTPLEAMRTAVRKLAPMEISYAFLGGAIVPLLLDNPRLTEFRPTKDVDAIVQIVTTADYYQLEDCLTKAGFLNLSATGGPVCRWQVEDCIIDLLPTKTEVLGLTARWFPEALETAVLHDLGEGVSAWVITVPYFLATKLDAFRDRGSGDYYASHDLEDIITVIDGNAGIAEEVASTSFAVRSYIAETTAALLADDAFQDALPGHFPSDPAAATRRRIVLNRMMALSQL